LLNLAKGRELGEGRQERKRGEGRRERGEGRGKMREIYNGNGNPGHCLLASKQTEIGRSNG
jgi:hypothetical protein